MAVAMDDETHRDQHLVRLPAEMVEHILMWLDPASLLTAAGVCRMLHSLIRGNKRLFHDVYLLHLDQPDTTDLDWESELVRLCKIERIFSPRNDPDKQLHHLPAVHDTITRLLRNASCSSGGDEPTTSRNVERLCRLVADNEPMACAFMQQSSLFERMRKTAWQTTSRGLPPATEEHQMSARLHCLYGRPIHKGGRTRSNRSYPYACSRVYDMRLYTPHTMWGPFRDDTTRRVDWEKVEAISIILSHNVRSQWPRTDIFDDLWDTPFYGSFPRSYVPATVPRGLTDLDARDPYGVTGSWYRIVCFLDYSDFFHYNFSMGGLVPHNTPRPPLSVGEATRLIIMELRATSIEPPGPDDGQDLPVVHFEGESRSLDHSLDDNANSGIRGLVRLTKEGEVWWTTNSVFHGQERWRSESIQVGGVRSARGNVGTWFDRDYDVHGPVGPTAFWKATDAEDPRGSLLNGMSGMPLAPGWPQALLENAPASEEEMMFIGSSDDDDDWDADLDPIDDELPGLLQDAEMDLVDVAPQGAQGAH